MRFIMPESFTLETLPTPPTRGSKSGKCRRGLWQHAFFIGSPVTQPAGRAFGVEKALERDGVKTVGKANYAAYQPPFAIPFMKKYEMQIEVAVDSG